MGLNLYLSIKWFPENKENTCMQSGSDQDWTHFHTSTSSRSGCAHYWELTQDCVSNRPQTQMEQTTPERLRVRPVWYSDTSQENRQSHNVSSLLLCVCVVFSKMWLGGCQPVMAVNHNNKIRNLLLIYSGSSALTQSMVWKTSWHKQRECNRSC